MIQDHSDNVGCIKGTDDSTLEKDLSVSLMHHDPSDLNWIIDTDPDQTKGMQTKLLMGLWCEESSRNLPVLLTGHENKNCYQNMNLSALLCGPNANF